MRFTIKIAGMAGDFHAASAHEAARKVRALETAGQNAMAYDENDEFWPLEALDAQAGEEKARVRPALRTKAPNKAQG
jgi:hypothetical protein